MDGVDGIILCTYFATLLLPRKKKLKKKCE